MTGPIAWINKYEIKYLLATKQAGGRDWKSNLGLVPEEGDVPLYLKKEWVGLTDDDVDYFVDAIYKGFDMKPRNEIEIEYFKRVIKFVGAKLEDKNT